MSPSLFAAVVLAASAAAPAAGPSRCPPPGYDRARLDALKQSEWVVADEAERDAFALALADCLGAPDPTLRDGIAFEALSHFLRNRQLSDATMLALADDLEARLVAPDPQGFEHPFAALALSEVARADRIEAFLTEPRRLRLVDAATSYLTAVRDYRGFDPREGYRHGVAHGADLMLQLALNKAIGKPELQRIRDAVASQIAPEAVFYITGESERLARPILFLAQRDVWTAEEWSAWFAQISGPGPLGASWDGWFLSDAGLARRHDLTMFLSAIYIQARLGANPTFASLLPGVEAAIRAVP